MQTLLRCPYISRAQFVRTLEIPNTGSHMPLFGHTKILHTPIGMGSAALAAALLYHGKATRISRKGQSTKKKQEKKKKKKIYPSFKTDTLCCCCFSQQNDGDRLGVIVNKDSMETEGKGSD